MTPVGVTAAVIRDSSGRYLITRRPAHKSFGGLWEFPGGKINAGETPEECLHREIREELDIEITIEDFWGVITHPYDAFILQLYTYLCSIKSGDIILHEHSEFRWIEPDDFDFYELPPADRDIVIKIRHINHPGDVNQLLQQK